MVTVLTTMHYSLNCQYSSDQITIYWDMNISITSEILYFIFYIRKEVLIRGLRGEKCLHISYVLNLTREQ